MSLRTWISDQLHAVAGFTTPAIIDYLIAQAAAPTATASQLEAFLLQSATDSSADKAAHVRAFARELIDRVPKKASTAARGTAAEEERRKREAARRNAAYTMVADSGLDEEEEHRRRMREAKQREKEARAAEKVKRRERRSPSSDEEDERPAKRRERDSERDDERSEEKKEERKESDGGEDELIASMTAAEEAEYRKQQDRQARDAFIARLAERDKAKTKLVADKGAKQRERDEKELSDMTQDEMRALLPQLRRKARDQYLTRREQQQLQLLQATLEDEQSRWKDEELTERERRELSRRRKLLELAQQRKGLSDEVAVYRMPEAYVREDGSEDVKKRQAVLERRYVEETKKGESEYEGWEREQSKKSQLSVGSKKAERGQEYEYVFDEEQIEFVKAEMMAGTDAKAGQPTAKEEAGSQAQSDFERMQDSRRKLPIYPYRTELLAAIRQYQVLIIVGETGSGKCFARGTRLRLFNGDTVAVEDVAGGELLMGDDGLSRIVTAGSLTHGVATLYRITPSWDGAKPFTVNGDHILVLVNDCEPTKAECSSGWTVRWWELTTDNVMRERSYSRGLCTEEQAQAKLDAVTASWAPLEWEVSVEEFLRTSVNAQRNCKLMACQAITFINPLLPSLHQVLAAVLGVSPTPAQLEYVAWWLGIWLTNGESERATVCQATAPPPDAHHHRPIFARLLDYQRLFNQPVDQAFDRKSDADWDECWFSYSVGGVADLVLRAYGLINNKHIPQALICDSLDVRRRLMAGLLDGAGSYARDNNIYEITALHRRVLVGCKELAATLGLRNGAIHARSIHITPHTAEPDVDSQTGKLRLSHSIHISGDTRDVLQYCVAACKQCPSPIDTPGFTNKTNVESRCYGFTITELPVGDYFGFAVHGGVNRRFLLDDYTVTHNVSASHHSQHTATFTAQLLLARSD